MMNDFEAVFSWEQVQEREAQGNFGVERRAMLATLTRSRQQLEEGLREGIELETVKPCLRS